jgi:SulP family sulfate permease
LFFGAAQQAMRQLDVLGADVRVVIFDLSKVSVIDATGLVALESAIDRLNQQRVFVILSGPLPKPKRIFDTALLEKSHRNVLFSLSLDQATATATDLVRLSPEWDAVARQA